MHDDPEVEVLVAGLLSSGTVRITALNVIEACGTEDPMRRRSLIGLQKRLAVDYRPLAVPNELLQELAMAHAKGAQNATITIGEAQHGIWAALNDPSKLGEEERQEVFRWKSKLEDGFAESHRVARPEFQKLLEEGVDGRPRTVSELIRHYANSEDFVRGVVCDLYREITGCELEAGELKNFFADLPQWPLYLLSWVHAIFNRAIKQQNFGVRKNPGIVDLWCSIYLPSCDLFITHDANQRRALRLLNVLNSRRTRILSYQLFRQRLLVL